MNARTIARLASLLRVAAEAAGLDPADVMSGPEAVGIIGTGVDIAWERDALGVGEAGWQVRETCHVVDVMTNAERTETEVAGCFSPEDTFQAARAAVMSVIQRRVEAALSGAI